MIEITQDGHGWEGTFGVAVKSIAADLLADGEPAHDVVVTRFEDSAVTGALTAVRGASDVLVVDGVSIAVEDIQSLRITCPCG